MSHDQLNVGLAQISPVWLNKALTIDKIISYIEKAASEGCELVAFGEALLPGYPFWIELTHGSDFNSAVQKELFSHYVDQAVNIDGGDLDVICKVAKERNITVILGCIEKTIERGLSLYCSLVYISNEGTILSVHRKLMPTYEERLAWSPGDGNGLRVHDLKAFRVGALNCWENWMPLPRAVMYAQGETFHVAIWPGGYHNTHDITKFIAKESRSFVMSVSGLINVSDFPKNTPHLDLILENAPSQLSNGGSCLAGPDGEWLIEPTINKECLLTHVINHKRVREERQNFDPAGHYSRPDVTQLTVNRERQSTVKFND